jgi:agmatinase
MTNENEAGLQFLGIPFEPGPAGSSAAVVLLPVPYDETSTWMKGAEGGPRAMLEASAAIELYDIETESEPYRAGIMTRSPVTHCGDPEGLAELVSAEVAVVLRASQLPVVLGGEHSVSIGAINACADRFQDLSVLQIDAHGDTRETYEGSTHNHACVMARARERCPIVQVGIRSLDASEVESLDRTRVFFAHDIAAARDTEWMDHAVGLLTEHVYVTIDLDAFDPAVLPATGTPEPGGLDWYEVTELLRRVSENRTVVGFDVVELLPAPGQQGSAFTAAKLVYRFIAMILSARGGG